MQTHKSNIAFAMATASLLFVAFTTGQERCHNQGHAAMQVSIGCDSLAGERLHRLPTAIQDKDWNCFVEMVMPSEREFQSPRLAMLCDPGDALLAVTYSEPTGRNVVRFYAERYWSNVRGRKKSIFVRNLPVYTLLDDCGAYSFSTTIGGGAICGSGMSVDGMRLTVRPVKASFECWRDVALYFTLKNESATSVLITVPDLQLGRDLSFVYANSDGVLQSRELTLWNLELESDLEYWDVSRPKLLSLEPGKAIDCRVTLRSLVSPERYAALGEGPQGTTNLCLVFDSRCNYRSAELGAQGTWLHRIVSNEFVLHVSK